MSSSIRQSGMSSPERAILNVGWVVALVVAVYCGFLLAPQIGAWIAFHWLTIWQVAVVFLLTCVALRR